MIALRTYSSRIEAEIARTILETYGVWSEVSADDQGGLVPQMAFTSGVRLKVRPEDQVQATQILDEQASGSET